MLRKYKKILYDKFILGTLQKYFFIFTYWNSIYLSNVSFRYPFPTCIASISSVSSIYLFYNFHKTLACLVNWTAAKTSWQNISITLSLTQTHDDHRDQSHCHSTLPTSQLLVICKNSLPDKPVNYRLTWPETRTLDLWSTALYGT